MSRQCMLLLLAIAVVDGQFLRGQEGPVNPVWQNVLDINIPEQQRQYATPLFWHIHKAGGTTLHDYFGSCLNLTIAAEVGITDGHGMETQLSKVVIDERNYINIDTSTEEGILRASQLGFRNHRKAADVVISPLMLPAAQYLFSKDNKAAMFAIMRHPVDRTISMFYYLQGATWEPTYNEKWATMTLMDYINSDIVESNWMVRFLVGKTTGAVDEHDLEEAKAVLRDKCWIGLQVRMEESVRRFGRIFGWDQLTKWNECVSAFSKGKKRSNSNKEKVPVSRESDEWTMLQQINALDMKLFAYARELYRMQGQLYLPEFNEMS